MRPLRSLLFAFTFAAFALTACAPAAPAPATTSTASTTAVDQAPAPAHTPTASTTPAAPAPAHTPTASSTPAESAPAISPTPFPFSWAGLWNVWIGTPTISIVKTIDLLVDGTTVRAEWYEGTRHVILEGTISTDGATLTGSLWNSDVEIIPIVLVLAPEAGFFTGSADSEAGPGQFCGTRIDPARPDPCRTDPP